MCLRTGYNVIIIGVLGFLGIGCPRRTPTGAVVKDTYE
jgi:ABC-type dipeptide/oligopeptide/nickel transport system permease subunit